MHELSLAINIVEIVEEHAKAENARWVKEVELDVGELSGVVLEALEFALDSAIKRTLLEDAQITINKISGMAKCSECALEFETDDYYSTCPRCSSFNTEIIKGKEFKVKSITVE
jgi:hydrogenase nickel incorporation protein HypA/HybF